MSARDDGAVRRRLPIALLASLLLAAGLAAAPGAGPAAAAVPNPPRGLPYWSGWDIARDVVTLPDGNGGYVLDGFGGLHPFGRRGHAAPAAITSAPYWSGWDIARAVALTGPARGYLLDGFGGVHRFGGAAPIATPLPYWRGRDLARDLVVLPDRSGGFVLDAQGGVYPFAIGAGSAPSRPGGAPYWPYPIARDLDLLSDGSGGFVLDGYGALHPVGSPSVKPDSPTPYWLGWDIARAVTLLPDRTGGYLLDGYGGLHPFSLGSGPPTLTLDAGFMTGLVRPWDLGFTPDGWLLYTERPNGISAARADGTARRLLHTPPDLFVGSEGGTLGLAIDPGYATNHRVYVCHSSTAPDVRLVRYVVAYTAGAPTSLTGATPIMTGAPRGSGRHNGCRPRFGPDGALWVGTGDAAIGTAPQDLGSLGGKVLRITTTGAAAPGNPALGAGADPRIWSWGHRNVQGIAFAPGAPAWHGYSVEHGTDRDDEVNRLVAGNFGWDPVPGYDETRPMTDLVKFPSAVVASWRSGFPTIAPSGATFLTGAQWRGWQGALAVAVLKGAQLRVLFPQPNGGVTGTTVALGNGVRLRSAVQGPDGALYLSTDGRAAGDQIWRVVPG
jgi:glucose/arabinose dehydrogenase